MNFKNLTILLIFALPVTVNAFEIIQGNSDEYILTMEKLNKAEQLLTKSINLLQETHINGYKLPNSNLQEIVVNSTKLREDLLLLLRPEIIRSKAYKFIPDEDFIVEQVNEMKHSKNLGN